MFTLCEHNPAPSLHPFKTPVPRSCSHSHLAVTFLLVSLLFLSNLYAFAPFLGISELTGARGLKHRRQMASLQLQAKQLEELNEDFLNESSRMVKLVSGGSDG